MMPCTIREHMYVSVYDGQVPVDDIEFIRVPFMHQ